MARFHGKTISFAIEYRDIWKTLLLPTENEMIANLVLKLHDERPIYQGKTMYQAVIMKFDGSEEIEAQV